jgi:hypothetical protein
VCGLAVALDSVGVTTDATGSFVCSIGCKADDLGVFFWCADLLWRWIQSV